MRIKSYYSGTVEAAMERARRELGEEAMILETRPAPAEARHLGAHEVVFGVDENTAPAVGPAQGPPAARPAATGRGPDSRDHGELQQLKQMIRGMRQELEDWGHLWRTQIDSANAANENSAEPRILRKLLERDLPLPLAARIARNTAQRAGRPADEQRIVREELSAFAPCDPGLGRVVVLAGPAGAGKTATAVKLAATLGLDARRSIQIISADPYRVAAAEQLRTYAGILGLAFEAVSTPDELDHTLGRVQNKDLILVDSAGFSASQESIAAQWANYFRHAAVDLHLVLPATLRLPDLEVAWARFAGFGPSKLLFTRLDEALGAGVMIAACCRTELPVSFLATGPGIPEDLEPASTATLVNRFLGVAAAIAEPAIPRREQAEDRRPPEDGWRRFDWSEVPRETKGAGMRKGALIHG